jgi:hypothetical protein
MRGLLEEARLFARNLAYHRRARLEGSPGAGARGGGAPDRRAATREARVTYPRIAPVLCASFGTVGVRLLRAPNGTLSQAPPV